MTLPDVENAPPIHLVRREIREEKPYLVSTPPGIDVKLNQNESPFDLPDDLKGELLERFRGIPFNRYPTDQPDRLLEAISGYNDWPVEGILAGNGSNDLSHTLALCFVAPGARVVLPRPMFALYASVVRMYGGSVVGVPCREDLSSDTDAVIAAVREHQPPLTILATPNNPTGRAMPLREVEAVVDAADGVVVVDEAYVEFSEEGSALELLRERANLVVMRTFSKAWGLAALRLGYLLGHADLVREMLKARLPFMVDPLSEETAVRLLEHPELVDRRAASHKASLAVLTAGLQDLPGVEVVPSQANFVLFKSLPEPEALMARLAERGVLVRNMGGYPELDGFLRVNAGSPNENKAFLDALKSALQKSL